MSLSRLTSIRRIPHLLLSGYNPLSPPSTSQSSLPSSTRQSPSNPSLTPVPLETWLSQLGRQHDIPTRIHSISSSTGHSLITYRNEQGVDRVIALGRNESGQLGIGFASQEGTRGLVEGFTGESVELVKTALQASYLVVKQDESTCAALNSLSFPLLASDESERISCSVVIHFIHSAIHLEVVYPNPLYSPVPLHPITTIPPQIQSHKSYLLQP